MSQEETSGTYGLRTAGSFLCVWFYSDYQLHCVRRSRQVITVSTNCIDYRICRTQRRWESLTHLWQRDIVLFHYSHYSSLRPFRVTKVSCGLWLQWNIARWFRCLLRAVCVDVVIFALSKLDLNYYSLLTLTKPLRCESCTKIKYLIVESLLITFREGPIFAEANTVTVQSELFVKDRSLCDRVSAPR